MSAGRFLETGAGLAFAATAWRERKVILKYWHNMGRGPKGIILLRRKKHTEISVNINTYACEWAYACIWVIHVHKKEKMPFHMCVSKSVICKICHCERKCWHIAIVDWCRAKLLLLTSPPRNRFPPFVTSEKDTTHFPSGGLFVVLVDAISFTSGFRSGSWHLNIPELMKIYVSNEKKVKKSNLKKTDHWWFSSLHTNYFMMNILS